jgi:endonuclease III
MTCLQSGPIWNSPPTVRTRKITQVCRKLEQEYGRPRLGNPRNPVDDLVYIILSNKTSPQVARKIYQQLKHTYPNWQQLLDAPIVKVRKILRPGGLSRVKSNQIRAALRRISKDWGQIRLIQLRQYLPQDAEAYLTSLPGVSEKVAKCVMMYTLGFDVLPVDTHVHRVATRLGWTQRKRADQCHVELEALVKPKRRFAFHVDSICHGREVCTPSNPSCHLCLIQSYCIYYQTNAQEN